IDLSRVDVPAIFIRFPPVEARCFQSEVAMSQAECDHVAGDVSRVMEMVSQRSNRVLRCRGAVRISRWPHSRVADRCKIEREHGFLVQLVVIECSQLHEEVVRVLAVNDWFSECGFALLEQLWITLGGNCCRLQTQHGSQGQSSTSEVSLRHGHEPVRGKELVCATRARLLDLI